MKNEFETYKNHPERLYSQDFFHRNTKTKKWQTPLAQTIAREYKLKSIVDFGCASGFYLEGFQKENVVIKGYEYLFENAKPFMSANVRPYIEQGDMMCPINCGKFEMSMSIEVAEHILPEKSDIFIDNLTNASDKYIMFTAATPGQGGTGHINEQPKDFWIQKFKKKNFGISITDIHRIQKLFEELPFVSKYTNLIRKNIMFFVKEQ